MVYANSFSELLGLKNELKKNLMAVWEDFDTCFNRVFKEWCIWGDIATMDGISLQ